MPSSCSSTSRDPLTSVSRSRLSSPRQHELDHGAPRKDLNFLEQKLRFRINGTDYKDLTNQLKRDSQFLRDCNIIDYSILLGIQDMEKSPRHRDLSPGRNHNADPELVAAMSEATASDMVAGKRDLICLPTSDKRYLLYLGIIDTFTSFNCKKKFESSAKRVLLGKGISCVPPDKYAERFEQFMRNVVFEEGPSSPQNRDRGIKSVSMSERVKIVRRNQDNTSYLDISP